MYLYGGRLVNATIHDGRGLEPEARTPAWVIRTSDYAALVARSPLAVHVRLLLESYADPQGRCWCSQRRLARLTGSYRRSVVEALGVLVGMGWLQKVGQKVKDDGTVLSDLYQLRFPEDLDRVRGQINDRIAGRLPAGVEIPWMRDDDVFQGHTQLYQRMARIPRSVLASQEWARLRQRSGQAMHLYLLLACYAPNGERVGGRRLADECHLSRPLATGTVSIVRVRTALRTLSDPADQWIAITHRTAENGGTATSSYTLVERLFEESVALDADGAVVEEEDLPTDGPPPQAMIDELPGPQKEACGLSDADAWALVHAHGLAADTGATPEGQPPAALLARLPDDERELVKLSDAEVWALIRAHRPRWRAPRETLDQAAIRMIRQFHKAVDYGQHPDLDTSTYDPTAAERELVRDLFRAFGREGAWKVANAALRHVVAKRWTPGNFTALRAFLRQAYTELRLVPKVQIDAPAAAAPRRRR